MRGPYMFGMVVVLPLGLLATVAGIVLGLTSGNWTVLWIGLALVIIGPVFAFGSMALFANRVHGQVNEFATNMIRKEWAGGSEPLVGVEIPWKDIVRQVFLVTDFDRKDTQIVDDKVVDPGANKPYGYLVVESPILNQAARLPLIHRDDFWLAASVFDDPRWSEVIASGDGELLATYAPRKVLANGFSGDPTHCVHYVLCPPGTLAKYYNFNADEHMRRPAPERLFGGFIYEGQVSVGVNQNPLEPGRDA
jgi:hypothetical protein